MYEYPFLYVGQDTPELTNQQLRDAITLLCERLSVVIVNEDDCLKLNQKD